MLAGGESRRMGRSKALLPVAGRTLVEWQFSRLGPSFLETLIAVAAPEQLPARLRALAVMDSTPGRGPLAGLEAGLKRAESELVFAMAVDMPYVHPSHANRLAGLLGGHEAAVPLSDRGADPLCALYRRSAALAAASAALAAGELRLTDLLRRLDVAEVDAALLGDALTNLNTPADYEAFFRRQGAVTDN